jgi:hypothetical protein
MSLPKEFTNKKFSPLQIAESFVKKYYKTLETDPDNLYRFYKPISDNDSFGNFVSFIIKNLKRIFIKK